MPGTGPDGGHPEVIGFIGPGRLGQPMVHRLLAAGHQVLVYARRDEVRDRLWIHGAALADSVAEVAADSDIIISCLCSDAQIEDLGYGPGGVAANARPGALFVSHTTGALDPLTELAASSSGRLQVLDAPVQGTPEDVAVGAATVLLGGAAEAIERAKPVLAAYAKPVIATGELGSALHLQLINNLLFAANAQLLAAAGELGQRLRIDPAALLNALTLSTGGSAAASQALITGSIDAFAATAGPLLRKHVSACLEAADRAGADPGSLRTIVHTGPLGLAPGRP